MTTPTNIRFTAEESAAIDSYAERKHLRRTSAVRELVRIGLQHAESSGLNIAAALHEVAAQLGELRAEQKHIKALLQRTRPD